MDKLKELRLTTMILVCGLFLLTGCFFNEKHTISFKTNGGGTIENMTIKKGNKLEKPADPKKDGYVFMGWYVNGEEFDFNTKVDEDMTLVAKWTALVDDDVSEDETTSTTSTVTTKKVTSKKTTSKKTVDNLKATTTAKRTTTTSTTTHAIIVPSVVVPTVPTTQIVTTSKVVPINVSKDEHENVKVVIGKSEAISNVESEIDPQDYEALMMTDKANWKITSQKGELYLVAPVVNEFDETIFNLPNKEAVNSFSLYDGINNYIFEEDVINNKWTLKYPTVNVGIGIDLKYFANLKQAVLASNDLDTITLMSNQLITEEIIIDKPLIINGDGYSINASSDYLFKIKDINAATDVLTIKNIKGQVKSFYFVDSTVSLLNISLEELNIIYENEVSNQFTNVAVVLNNVFFSGLL